MAWLLLRGVAAPAATRSWLPSTTLGAACTRLSAYPYSTLGLEASSSKSAAVQELEENSRTIPAVQKKGSNRVRGSRVLRVNIRLEGIDHTVLDSYVEYLRRMALGMGLRITGRIPLPTKIEKFTVLKSPHVSKKHRDQFARVVHNRLLQVFDADDDSLETYLKFVENECPPGVIARLTEYHHGQLPEAIRPAGRKDEDQ